MHPSGSRRDGIRYRWRDPVAADAVDTLQATAFAEEPGRYRWSQCRPQSLGWVTATRRRDLVGFVNVVSDGDHHAFLLDIAVAPDQRRRGIGREMVRRTAIEARRAGCDFVHADFEPRLTAFYRSSGFTETAAGLLFLG